MNEPIRPASIPVVRSVTNALDVIEALSQSSPLTAAQLARELKLPKSTVFRALRTLESSGWAQSSATPRAEWSLTNRVFELGLYAHRNSDPLDAAIGILVDLRDEFSETTCLLVPSVDELIVIAREDGTNPIRAFIELGARVSLASTASGRAYLSALTDHEVIRLLRLNTDRGKSLSYEKSVLQEVAEARQSGYAIDDGLDLFERRPAVVVDQAAPDISTNGGVAGVAAPVLDAQGEVKGVITITMPTSAATSVDLDLVGKNLADVCRRLRGSKRAMSFGAPSRAARAHKHIHRLNTGV